MSKNFEHFTRVYTEGNQPIWKDIQYHRPLGKCKLKLWWDTIAYLLECPKQQLWTIVSVGKHAEQPELSYMAGENVKQYNCSRKQFGSLLHSYVCAQSLPTLYNPMHYSLPGSFVHGILQARILEWVTISYSRRSFRPKK